MKSFLYILSILAFLSCEEPIEAEPAEKPVMQVNGKTITETNDDQEITLQITFSRTYPEDIDLLLSTSDETATGGEDYLELNNFPLTLPTGETSVSVTLTVYGDELYEDDEIFTLEVNAEQYTVNSQSIASIRILNDDPIPVIEIPTTGYTTPNSYEGMTLLWEEDFSGSELNAENWTYELGGSGWGNNELQYYTNENITLQDGNLIIEARKEPFGGRDYTSSRIVTQDKFEFQYGRVDVRAALPEGQGIWPAIWMLGASFPDVGWPYCGEIDIMEMIGGQGRENEVHGTVHWQGPSAKADFGDKYTLSSGSFQTEFNVFSITWDENSIKWLVNDVQFHQISLAEAHLSEFKEPFFFILNVAVGGIWPGSPDANTVFPQRMIVDYIRVFQPIP